MTLVDSRSTHMFISNKIPHNLDLLVHPRLGMSIKVSNDDCLPYVGVCPDTIVNIHGKLFTIDCYILPLGGFDVILGVY